MINHSTWGPAYRALFKDMAKAFKQIDTYDPFSQIGI